MQACWTLSVGDSEAHLLARRNAGPLPTTVVEEEEEV
jgi:hypothetical protein